MFLIESNDKFFETKVANLFKQKKNLFSTFKNDNYFAKISFKLINHNLNLEINNKKITKINLPVSFKLLFYQTVSELKIIKYHYKELSYSPINQIVSYKSNFLNLINSHNTILIYLLLNKQGVSKDIIYKNLWPNDKVQMINKLDTHLTNLKNNLKKEIGYELKLHSLGGIVKLV